MLSQGLCIHSRHGVTLFDGMLAVLTPGLNTSTTLMAFVNLWLERWYFLVGLLMLKGHEIRREPKVRCFCTSLANSRMARSSQSFSFAKTPCKSKHHMIEIHALLPQTFSSRKINVITMIAISTKILNAQHRKMHLPDNIPQRRTKSMQIDPTTSSNKERTETPRSYMQSDQTLTHHILREQ